MSTNSFKSLLSDQVVAPEYGTALKDVLRLFFLEKKTTKKNSKNITLNGKKSLSKSLFDILNFLLKDLVTTSRMM